jgi:hypothetical protein
MTMAEKVIIELPEDIVRQVRTVAARTQRSVDEVLVDWIRRAGSEPVLELLPDEELMAVCDSQPDSAEQEELTELLERNQEGALLAPDRDRLDELMWSYRAGLVRKAQALRMAVGRGLRPRLS